MIERPHEFNRILLAFSPARWGALVRCEEGTSGLSRVGFRLPAVARTRDVSENHDAPRSLEAERGAGRRIGIGCNDRKYEIVLRRGCGVRRSNGGHILEHLAAARVDHAEGVGTGGSGAEVRSRHVEVAVPGIVPGLIPAADRQDGRDIAGPRVHEERPPAPRYHHSSVRPERWVIDAEEPPGGGSEPERLAIDVVLLFHRKGRDRGIEKQYDIDCQALGLTATAGGLFGINDPSLG